jgi:uncharacterized membrane protein
MAEHNANSRLEAFCDGVFAIALTLLIIEIHAPERESIETTAALWEKLRHLAPSVFAFVLSFCIILITWVNHHATIKLVHKSSASFIYANGFLLLTVVFIPFPTALLGQFIGTDHAAPAVVLYNAVLAIQALGWIAVSVTACGNGLCRDEPTATAMRKNGTKGYFAFGFYALRDPRALVSPRSRGGHYRILARLADVGNQNETRLIAHFCALTILSN